MPYANNKEAAQPMYLVCLFSIFFGTFPRWSLNFCSRHFKPLAGLSLSLSEILNIDFVVTRLIRGSSRENRSSGFPTRSNTSQVVQSKMARGLKFRIYLEGLCCQHDQCIEYKDADQLHGYVFTYEKFRFSHDAAHLFIVTLICIPLDRLIHKISKFII